MFGNKKSNAVNSSSTTIITQCMEIKGNVKGCGTIHIDGTVHGDIDVEENVVIGESGTVYGTIKSKNILISGRLEGSVFGDTIEITKSGTVSNKIEARELICDGDVEATLFAHDTIRITDNGKIKATKMESKHIIVSGFITGNVVASNLLEINNNGQVKGEMIVKKIKVAEGGLMLGTMMTYEASDSMKTVKVKPVAKTNTKEEDTTKKEA